MFKIFLSFIMLFNTINCSTNYKTKLEKIEFINNSDVIKLKIILNSLNRDVVELKIDFLDKDKNSLEKDSYSSALTINGRKETIAKIPLLVKDKIYLTISLFSSNANEEIENVIFPIYPREYLNCDLSLNKICESTYPSIITYQNNILKEEYEKIALTNRNLKFVSFNNFVPISKIGIVSNLDIYDGYANMYLNKKVEEIDVYYNDGYVFPLNITKENNIIKFEFANKYYIDLIAGKTSENYKINSKLDNEVLLPYKDENYEFVLEIKDSFISFERVIISFDVIVENALIGNCDKAKYCIRRSYL